MAKTDLHIHSRFSVHSPEYLFRRAGIPHGTTEPENVYNSLKEAGMDFVTLTDHDTIEGCLAIAHHPDVFLSEEITTRFPDDPAEIHVLAWGITERQHDSIQEVRRDIFDLTRYLRSEQIAHGVAHPLKSHGSRLTTAQLARLLLLFRNLETVNGQIDPLYNDATKHLLTHLDPDRIQLLESKYPLPSDLAPVDDPHRGFGGSNDHTGLAHGCAWTRTSEALTIPDLLTHLRVGSHSAHGDNGGPVRFSHRIYQGVLDMLRSRNTDGHGVGVAMVNRTLDRFVKGENPTKATWTDQLKWLGETVVSGRWSKLARKGANPFYRDVMKFLSRHEFQSQIDTIIKSTDNIERRAFLIANLMSDKIAFVLVESVASDFANNQPMEAIERISSAAPLALLLAPYFYAFQSQSPSCQKLERTVSRLLDRPVTLRPDKRAWFTDTLYDVNGVSMTIRKMTAEAARSGCDLTIVTSSDTKTLPDLPIKNFTPVGEFAAPEYEEQKIASPPLLRVIDYVQANQFTEIIISTPGPVGLCGMLAAKLAGIRTSTIYHTDFPQYVGILTKDRMLETIAWRFMHWFYDLSDTIYVNSNHYREIWEDRGIKAEKIAVLPRGMDTSHFHPDRRNPDFWKRFGSEGTDPVALFVGRVSKEKDLDVFIAAARQLHDRGVGFRIAIIGNGPYLEEVRQQLPEAIHPGYVTGPDLAEAYASADVFAFPSTTDTYGNVVVESMACGVPCIVSDIGGPRDLVNDGITGIVTPGRDIDAFTGALEKLLTDADLRKQMGRAARDAVANRNWAGAFKRFWEREHRGIL